MTTEAVLRKEPPVESWRQTLREGFFPLMSTAALEALRKGLAEDDPRLLQGATTTPPPLYALQDWPVEGACALGYAGWQGENLESVAEVEEYFARLCVECDQRFGEPAGCRHFLNPWDECPREAFFPQVLAEVERELADRRDVSSDERRGP